MTGDERLHRATHRARRRFGQNFLHDASIVARIVDELILAGPDDCRNRPGSGGVDGRTDRARRYSMRSKSTGIWRRRCANASTLVMTLTQGDVLELDWDQLARPMRIVGNLPYNISTPLLFRLWPIADRVIDQHFMLQKEVVERMVAPPGSKAYGQLSVMLQFRYRLSKLFDVPPEAFKPAPKVTSSVVRMQPRPPAELPDVDAAGFARVVAAAFGQRRKTLRNALGELLGASEIAAAGVDSLARAETLGVLDFVALARILVRK